MWIRVKPIEMRSRQDGKEWVKWLRKIRGTAEVLDRKNNRNRRGGEREAEPGPDS